MNDASEGYMLYHKKISGIDAPIIMGVSPWKTPYQLWLEKAIGEASSQQPEPELELARQAFEKTTGIRMFPKIMLHPAFDWMMASLDGIDNDCRAIVEIKCPEQIDHEVTRAGKVPEKYFPQLQHQLAVTGLEMAFYFSFDGNNGVILEVKRDDHFIAKMLDMEKEFWKCLSDLIPPPVCERDIVHREDEEWTIISQKWLNTHRQLKALEDEEKTLRETLIQMADTKNATGGGIRLSHSLRKGNVQYAQIPELKNIDLEKYRKEPTEVWRLTDLNNKK